MMRIAYVSLHWPRTIVSGVGKKILGQMNAWNKAGHNTKLFMHTVRRESTSSLLPGEVFFYSEIGGFRVEYERIVAARQLLNAVRQYQPDLIYLRYGMYVYPIQQLALIAPLVEEINTNDPIQHKRLGMIYAMYNRLTRGIILQRTSGLVCLSNELANLSSTTIFKKPTIVIGDGIDIQSVQPLQAPSNPHPQIAFIGTPGSPWQAVDKLPLLAKSFPELGIHIIGYDHIEGYRSLPANVRLYGYLNTKEYLKILAGMDCAIGTLGLHRIQLNESSPLKTRECLALGLPMILPYNDTDLGNCECDFLLKIPNKEDNIQTHAQAIHDFAYRMRGCRADREFLKRHIDVERKEAMRLSFFEEILRKPA